MSALVTISGSVRRGEKLHACKIEVNYCDRGYIISRTEANGAMPDFKGCPSVKIGGAYKSIFTATTKALSFANYTK